MKLSKKNIRKVVIIIMAFALISPSFLSITVSAIGKGNTKNEEDLQYSSMSEKETREIDESNEVKIDNDIMVSDDEVELKEDDKANVELEQTKDNTLDKTTNEDSENMIEKDQITEKEQESSEVDEYYSAEEIREQAIEIMDAEKDSLNTYDTKSKSISKTTAFISATSPYAVSVANKHGIYPSVMIAQAALESAWGTSILAYNPNYNYFGIKGNFNGNSFSTYTKEYDKKDGWFVTKANFKKYLSVNATFTDYANKLTKGPDWDSKNGSWDKLFYSGTWRKNAKTYKDATRSLLNKYATDPDYDTKLNSIIETYNLARFDKMSSSGSDESNLEESLSGLYSDEVTSTTNVKDYSMIINGNSDGIYSAPKNTKKSEILSTAMEYLGEKVIVQEEKKTKKGLTWAYITLDGRALGWIDIKGLTSSDVILSEKNTHYMAKVIRKTDGIYTLPYGLKDFKYISKSSSYYGKSMKITKEMVTTRATWSYIDGLGWIDKKGLDIETISSEKNTSYYKRISRKTDSINTQPWGTEGYRFNHSSSSFLGEKVKVIKEATTQRATWAYITLDGRALGWIDMKGLTSSDVALSEKNTHYMAKVNRKTDGIYTLPYGVKDSKYISKSSSYYGKSMKITKEMVTTRATWSYIDGLGWIDKKGLDIERISSEKNTSYYKRISRKTDSINTHPWGTEGYRFNHSSSSFLGKKVKVIKEATTQRANWAYITLDGKALGWIDSKGLTSSDVILSEKNTHYMAKVIRKTDGIYTLPYGLKDFKYISKSSSYYGKSMKISKEMVTTRATWAYIDGLGWIDKKGLDIERISSEKNTSYYKRISRKTDSINTHPWGTEGYRFNHSSSSFLGKKVKVIKEATTQRANWAYITLDGKALGWIDSKGLTSSDVILSEKKINYTGEITRKTDGIYTLPYGVSGAKFVSRSSSYYGEKVTISKEMVTTRATWVYIYSEGKPLGWIDKKGVKRVDLFSKFVVLDPGHGGGDPGAHAGNINEKDLNLTVAKKVKTKLEKAGYEVLMTRSTDDFIKLSERAAIANRANADIFVSVHTNSFNKSAHGIETYSYNANGRPNNAAIANNPKRLLNSSMLSQGTQKSLINNTKAYSRGAKKDDFHVIRETRMPAILVEIGFVDNTRERNKLVTSNYQNKLTAGIFGGIQNYFKNVR